MRWDESKQPSLSRSRACCTVCAGSCEQAPPPLLVPAPWCQHPLRLLHRIASRLLEQDPVYVPSVMGAISDMQLEPELQVGKGKGRAHERCSGGRM